MPGWETGPYAHPQGAVVTSVRITCRIPPVLDHVVAVWWMSDETGSAEQIGTVTLKAGKRIRVKALDRTMRPMESLVWVQSDQDPPTGVLATFAFNRGP